MRSRCRATALGQSSRSEKRPTLSCETTKPSIVMPRRRAEATQLVKGPRTGASRAHWCCQEPAGHCRGQRG
eukprot:9050597-Pyramimonas_sp.AAC.1